MIPLFFVASGMALDIRSVAEAPLRLLAFFVLLLVLRGVPALFLYRGDLPPSQRVQTMFLTATTLPLLVTLAGSACATEPCSARTRPLRRGSPQRAE